MKLSQLPKDEVPARLRPEFYFDFQAHPFAHAELLTSAHSVIDVLGAIHSYAEQWLAAAWERRSTGSDLGAEALRARGTKLVGSCPAVSVEPNGASEILFEPSILIGPLAGAAAADTARLSVGRGAQVLGGTFDLRAGSIWLGEGVTVEPGVHVAGPAIIGAKTTLRCGAYLRGDLVIGEGAVLRGELKNAVVMDGAELAHPGYTGDSIIGHRGHFGCQALSANLGLFGADLSVTLPPEGDGLASGGRGLQVALGRRKVGVILGDGSQLGCNSVTDPATFLGPRTHVYTLTRLASGFYGPAEIVKNKPEAIGAIIRVKLV